MKLQLGGRILSLRPVDSLENMTINQCAAGCELGRPGEGAVARRPRGKIDNIRWGGGGIAFIFRPGGLNRTICPVKILENMTIKCRTTGFGLKWLGDGVSAAAADNDDTTTAKPPTPPTTYRSLTCNSHQGRGGWSRTKGG
jgi:hypothetical protein